MPENNEVRTPRQEVQEITEQIRAQTAAQVAAEIQQEIEDEDIKLAAKRIRRRVDQEIRHRQNVPGSFEGDINNPDDEKGQAINLQKAVIKFIIAAKQDKAPLPQGIPTEQREFATRTVRAIANAVNPERITPSESPYLYDLVTKLISGEISDIESLAAVFQSNLQIFMANESNFQRLQEGFIQLAQEAGLEQTQAREKFGEEKLFQGRESQNETDPFEQDWNHYYRNFFGEEDREALKAFYFVEDLQKLAQASEVSAIKEFKETYKREPTVQEKIRITSEELERKIVLTFSTIYARADRQSPDITWDQVIQEGGFYDSPQAVSNKLKNAFIQMEKLARSSPEKFPQVLRNMNFSRRYSVETIGEKEISPDDPEFDDKVPRKTLTQYKVIPVAGRKYDLNLADFLSMVSNEVVHELDTREYLHNVQALFLRQGGEGGFYGQLAGYSEKMRSENIDSMMLLPDSDVFMAAYRLYTKFLEDEFAKWDWIHQPNMFSSDFFKPDSQIKQQVEQQLKKMYPELGKTESEWRLRRAISMGLGIAKGVLLSEVHIAASADPNVTVEDGAVPTFSSYYTNDNIALKPLNMMHHFFRWQAEGVSKGPLLFLPVLGVDGKLDPKLMRRWDHSVLWKNMKEYKESFLKGEIDQKMTGGKLFAELLPNIAKGGGIITRGGWRINDATRGWRVNYREEGNPNIGKLDVPATFKAFENIGYEAVALLTGDIKKFANSERIDQGEKDTFFGYLHKKYIDPDGRTDYKVYLKESCAGNYETYMNRIYAHMLHQRLPTKMVRLERSRTSKGGIRLWEKLWKGLGWSPDQVDSSMKNLSVVETKVREIVTKEMEEFLNNQPDENKDLSTFITDNYKVTEENIRNILRLKTNEEPNGYTKQEQDEAVALFHKINEVVIDSKYIDRFATKMQKKEFVFALGEEELEMSFLSWRNSGPRTLARALNDTAEIEQKIVRGLEQYLNMLQPISISGNKNLSQIYGVIKQMKDVIEAAHGQELSTRFAHHMAALTIAYFKKDSIAQHPVTRLFLKKGPASLAAEFAGTWSGVWEWDTEDIDAFIVGLTRNRILPKTAVDLSDQMGSGPEIIEKKFLGIIPMNKVIHPQRKDITIGQNLRENFGATKKDILFRLVTLYGPLIAMVLLWSALKNGFDELSENKRQ